MTTHDPQTCFCGYESAHGIGRMPDPEPMQVRCDWCRIEDLTTAPVTRKGRIEMVCRVCWDDRYR